VIRRSLLIALGLLAVSGCRERTPEVVVPAGHPADPSATAAPASPASTTLALDAAAPAATPMAPPTAESYTCPMHPEIVRSAPGKCPKCGMKLVPKTKAP
jgi:hypothetical protein